MLLKDLCNFNESARNVLLPSLELIPAGGKKGKFVFCHSQSKRGYDIFFIPDGEALEMEYVVTIPYIHDAEKICRVFEETHNKGTEIYKLVKETAEHVHADDTFYELFTTGRDSEAKDFIMSRLPIVGFEQILERPLKLEEIEALATNVLEWYC